MEWFSARPAIFSGTPAMPDCPSPRASCWWECPAAARASRPARWPAPGVCRCCGWTLAASSARWWAVRGQSAPRHPDGRGGQPLHPLDRRGGEGLCRRAAGKAAAASRSASSAPSSMAAGQAQPGLRGGHGQRYGRHAAGVPAPGPLRSTSSSSGARSQTERETILRFIFRSAARIRGRRTSTWSDRQRPSVDSPGRSLEQAVVCGLCRSLRFKPGVGDRQPGGRRWRRLPRWPGAGRRD